MKETHKYALKYAENSKMMKHWDKEVDSQFYEFYEDYSMVDPKNDSETTPRLTALVYYGRWSLIDSFVRKILSVHRIIKIPRQICKFIVLYSILYDIRTNKAEVSHSYLSGQILQCVFFDGLL